MNPITIVITMIRMAMNLTLKPDLFKVGFKKLEKFASVNTEHSKMIVANSATIILTKNGNKSSIQLYCHDCLAAEICLEKEIKTKLCSNATYVVARNRIGNVVIEHGFADKKSARYFARMKTRNVEYTKGID